MAADVSPAHAREVLSAQDRHVERVLLEIARHHEHGAQDP